MAMAPDLQAILQAMCLQAMSGDEPDDVPPAELLWFRSWFDNPSGQRFRRKIFGRKFDAREKQKKRNDAKSVKGCPRPDGWEKMCLQSVRA